MECKANPEAFIFQKKSINYWQPNNLNKQYVGDVVRVSVSVGGKGNLKRRQSQR
jgi:hypothetical protein